MIHQFFQTHCLVAPPRSATKRTFTSRKKSQYLQKLKVLNLNCNSIRSQNKSGLFKAKVEDEKPHIIIATESKLDDSIRNSEVFPSDYEIFRKDRKDVNPGGDVFIAVHNTIIATHQSKLDCQAEAIWIKSEIANQKPLYIASLYRPPGSNIDPLDSFKQSLERLQANGSFPRVIIARDMNVPDIDWKMSSVKDNPQYGVTVNQKFFDLVDDHGLTQLVTFPTRQESVLDLVLTSHPDLVNNLNTTEGISGIN